MTTSSLSAISSFLPSILFFVAQIRHVGKPIDNDFYKNSTQERLNISEGCREKDAVVAISQISFAVVAAVVLLYCFFFHLGNFWQLQQ